MADPTLFNPAAYPSWAPPYGGQGLVSPQVQGAPSAPSPGGFVPQQRAGAQGGQNSQAWGSLLQKAALMMKPQQQQVPPLQPMQSAQPGMLNQYGAFGR